MFDDAALRERALRVLGVLDLRHTPGGQPHNQQNHAGDAVPNVLDKLKLAGRIDLSPDETLVSSRRIRSGQWDVLAAEIDTPTGRQVRLGVIDPRDRGKWTGGPDPRRSARLAELDQQMAAMAKEGGDDATDTDEYARLQDERDELAGDSDDFNRTTSLTSAQVGQLRSDIEAGIASARAMIARDERPDSGEFASGVVAGGLDGDIEWRLDDAGTGEDDDWVMWLAIRPHGEGDDWLPEGDDTASFDPKNIKAFLKAIDELSGGQSDARSLRVPRSALREVVAREVQALLRSDVDDDPIGKLDDDTLVLLQAMAELDEESGVEGRAWNPELHKRWPKGHPKAGKFRPMVDMLKLAIANHDGVGHPFEHFNREQLRKAAKTRGIELKRGEDKDSIAAKLLADLGGTPAKSEAAPAKKVIPKETAAKLIPKAGSKVGDVLTGDFSSLKRVGPSEGTTPGGVFEAPDGSRWYVKAQKSADHANNEALASALYRAAGIDVPMVVRGKGTPGLPGDSHTATRMIDGAQANLAAKLSDDAYIAEIRKGFAADAWLANWDVVGEGSEHPWANIVEGADGRPHRIDVGGAILIRAMGGEKGDKFGPQVVEFDTMRTPAKGRRHALIFAEITDKQLSESVNRVRAITNKQIHDLVAEHGFDVKLAELLIVRREDLLSRMKASAKITPKGWAGAVSGHEALDAAPVEVGSWADGTATDTIEYLKKQGVDEETARKATRGFADYQDGLYGAMNKALLAAAGDDLREAGYQGLDDGGIDSVEAMDEAMKASRLTEDVIVYRGERAPARNFPPGTWSMTGGMEGMEWTFHPFGSSSADETVAKEFARGPTTASADLAQPTVLRILARKGTRAVSLKGTMSGEQELLLARGLKYRIVKDHGVVDDPGYIKGIRRLDVEVVPA